MKKLQTGATSACADESPSENPEYIKAVSDSDMRENPGLVWHAPTIRTVVREDFTIRLDSIASFAGELIPVAQVACHDCSGNEGSWRFMLWRGERGEYYTFDRLTSEDGAKAVKVMTRLEGKDAMRWLIDRFFASRHLRREFHRAVDNPEFSFMPLVAVREKQKRKRAAKPLTARFAVQLELATSLVEMVKALDARPNVETLAEARRKVSALHQTLHTEQAFKQAGGAAR